MHTTVYIFDADGVLNTMSNSAIDERVLVQLTDLLLSGHHVAINTGRGYPWVRDNVVLPLYARVTDAHMDNLFVAAEMGGIVVGFKDGVEQDSHTAFSLSDEHIAATLALFEAHKTPNVQWYEGKISMATVTKPNAVSIEAFAVDTAPIAAALRELFKDDHVKINHTADAVDVMTKEAGKWAGAQLIHDWLQTTTAAEATHFICFGDNTSDYDMASFFASQGKTVEFVFTGTSLGEITTHDNISVVQTSKLYCEATYTYLAEHNKQ